MENEIQERLSEICLKSIYQESNASVAYNVLEFHVLNATRNNGAIKLSRKLERKIFNVGCMFVIQQGGYREEISRICLKNFYLTVKLITVGMKL